MNWHYNCPNCANPLVTDWEKTRHELVCPSCKKRHFPPAPSEDHLAYVGSDRAPKEMEEVVVALHGTSCSVPGCFHEHTTFIHRKPVTRGGHTSVDNLLPMCGQHARELGLQDYEDWVKSLPSAPAASKQVVEITLTSLNRPSGESAGIQMTHGAGYTQTIAAAGPTPAVPSDLRLVTHTRLVPGPARWLVLKYDWRFKSGDALGIFLVAWPDGQEPSFAAATGRKSLVAAGSHLRKDGEAGSARLQVNIHPAAEEAWNVAVCLKGEADPATLERYVLFAAD